MARVAGGDAGELTVDARAHAARADPGRSPAARPDSNEGDEVSGRGWAVLADDGSLQGHLYFHLGDDSGFRAVRVGQESEIAPSARQPR